MEEDTHICVRCGDELPQYRQCMCCFDDPSSEEEEPAPAPDWGSLPREAWQQVLVLLAAQTPTYGWRRNSQDELIYLDKDGREFVRDKDNNFVCGDLKLGSAVDLPPPKDYFLQSLGRMGAVCSMFSLDTVVDPEHPTDTEAPGGMCPPRQWSMIQEAARAHLRTLPDYMQAWMDSSSCWMKRVGRIRDYVARVARNPTCSVLSGLRWVPAHTPMSGTHYFEFPNTFQHFVGGPGFSPKGILWTSESGAWTLLRANGGRYTPTEKRLGTRDWLLKFWVTIDPYGRVRGPLPPPKDW